MNTLDDLRRTLDHHAGDVHDDVVHSRTAAVRGRAVAVRRRRAAGVATAAALAVVGAIGLPQLPDTPIGDPTGGAPDTRTALGWTYRFDDMDHSDRDAVEVELEDATYPRLLSWATDGADQEVEVRAGWVGRFRSDRDDFDDHLVVPAGYSGKVRLTGPDGLSLATYSLDPDVAPEGVTVDGITYRDQVADQQLLGAEIGELGDDEVSVTYTVPAGDTSWSPFCAGASEDVWIHVDLGDRLGEMVSGPSCDDPTFDPGALGGYSGPHGRTGETITATLYLTAGEDGPRLDLDDVRLGLGVYSVAEPGLRVAGSDVAEVVESDGHLWSLDGADGAPRGTTELGLTNDDEQTWLVEAISSGIGNGLVRVEFPGRDGLINLGAGGSTQDHLAPGERVTMSARGDHPERVRLGFARYVRTD